MIDVNEVLELSAADEASRLWEASKEIYHAAPQDVSAILESLDLGIRAVEILGFHRIEPVRDKFPATIASHLEPPAPDVEVQRDAVEQPRCLGFRELLDLMSEEELPCVARDMHHGWEDRRCACMRGRALTNEAIGFSVGADDREQLLLLLAYRNRIFRYPPPVRIVVSEVVDSFPRLEELVKKLEA